MFFNDKGFLNIDEIVANNSSFKNIMEDGIVTEEEIKVQAEKVVTMLHEMETKYNEEQLADIKKLLVESSVLYAVYIFTQFRTLTSKRYGNLQY